jgi:hypothetical protein
MAVTVNVRMKQRRKVAADWTSANEVLLDGEIGYETDTRKFKFGDGATAWNSLAYASSGAVTSVAGRTGDVVLAKGDVGLGNVDNTSDADKPVSTATQTALNLKVNTSAVGTAAAQNTGTSGGSVPLLNGANTWSALQTLSLGVAGAGGGQSYINLTPTDYGTGKSRLTLESTAANVWQYYTWDGTTQGAGTLRLGIATVDVTGKLQADALQIDAGGGTAPATAGATGISGEIRWDASYIYVCTAPNTWKRVAIATW